MQTTANTSVESQPHEVETWSAWASRANNAYIGFLTLTLVATVLIVVFNSRLNKAKDAAYSREKQRSDETISTANASAANALKDAATANENAGKANVRAEKLEGDNLTLRSQVATLETAAADAKKDVAGLQKAAADARAEMARQEARAAKAEIELAEVQKEQEPRRLTTEQRNRIFESLRDVGFALARSGRWPTPVSPSIIQVVYAEKNVEAAAFAADIRLALGGTPFRLNLNFDLASVDLAPRVAQGSRGSGEGIWIAHNGNLSPEVKIIAKAFEDAALPRPKEAIYTQMNANEILVIVGAKPNARFDAELEREQEEWHAEMHRRAMERWKKMQEEQKARPTPTPKP